MVLLVPLDSSPSFSSSSSFQRKYDVFLSFRGSDTRTNFLDHLYAALHRKGVFAFKDDKELERGKNISLDLLEAIRDSRFAIIIFSKNYADSTWCLEELETIFECMKQGTLTVIPVFYGVDPSEVQELTGAYGEAFDKHANDYKDNPDKVLKWRVAMTENANVSGWDSQNRHEFEFIQDIVEELINQIRKVRCKFSKEEEGLVGIDKYLMQAELYLRERSNDVSVIGFCGMGGIGKTTIARALYSRLSNQFEWRTFLANVRDTEEKHGLVCLQKQLLYEILHEKSLRIWDIHKGKDEIRSRLHYKKTLLVLDDVDNFEQLKSVAGRSDWFAAGSIIIITTRNKHLLNYYDSYQLYEVTELNDEDALHLFCLKAFNNRQGPKESYEDLSPDFVKYCKGLPLGVEVIGSFLIGKSMDEWNSALERLKKIPNKSILDKLRISFDGLEEIEQQIFLDIACFFRRKSQDHVKRILESCNFYPDIGIRTLIDKSLISIDPLNRIMMHDLLQNMGQEIVRAQSPKEPGKRSRLWFYEDIYHVLSNNKGTKNVEGIMMEESYKEQEKWSAIEVSNSEVLMKMKGLHLLKLPSLNISGGLLGILNTLGYLNWDGYPFKSLPDAFHPNQLVELRMPNSRVENLWEGTKILTMLRVIDLSGSTELILTPDFTWMPSLEILDFKGCVKLSMVHKSIGFLEKLVSLDLKDCKSLIMLPSSICDVKSLKILNLNGCSSLEGLPERIGELAHLESLNLGGIGKGKMSLAKPWKFLAPWKKKNSIVSITLPSSLSNLRSLTELCLSGCHLKLIPFDFGSFPLLKILDLSSNDFVNIPASIDQLLKLYMLDLNNCKNLQTLPECSSRVASICVSDCASLESFSYPIFKNHRAYKSIIARNCFKLVENQKQNTFVLGCFTRFLLFLVTMKHQRQAQISLGSSYFMVIPGCDIPERFTYKAFDNQLVVPLPPNWCNDKWLGPTVACVFENETEHGVKESSRTPTLAFSFEKDGNMEDAYSLRICFCPAFDHLFILFLAFGFESRSVGWWNEFRKVRITYSEPLKMKMLGLRLIYEQDLEELTQYISPSESWRFDTGKRARQHDFYGDGEEESEEGGGSCSSSMELKVSSTKRLRTPDDDD